MFFDSTPSEMASGQEWESPGGAAPLFMLRLLFRFGFALVPVPALKMSVYD
jgi:hypothetical protein